MSGLPTPAARASAVALALLLAASAASANGEPEERGADLRGSDSDDANNAVLITIDTLRADHLGAYGYDRETSPAIDAFSREGVLFRNAIVPRGVTWPSLTSILTSLDPRTHGVRTNGAQLDASKRTVAELLAARGYHTEAFLSNMLNAPHRGFAEKHLYAAGDRDGRATRDVLAWLDERPAEPFFLWVHLLGPHDPYAPPPAYARRFARGDGHAVDGRASTLRRIHEEQRELSEAQLAHIVALYDAEVAQVDDRVGRILGRLAAVGLGERTLVILTSDHGEELYDHNRYFLHSLSIYDSVLRVPLVLRWPGKLPAGVSVDAVARSVDVTPTLLDLLGVEPLPSFEGRSLRLQLGAAPPAELPAFSALGPHIHSARTGRWHYVYNPRGHSSPRVLPSDSGDAGVFSIEREELYDVQKDPRQQHNVVAEHPEVAAGLRDQLERWLAEGGDEAPAPVLQPEVREELRALGYAVP